MVTSIVHELQREARQALQAVSKISNQSLVARFVYPSRWGERSRVNRRGNDSFTRINARQLLFIERFFFI